MGLQVACPWIMAQRDAERDFASWRCLLALPGPAQHGGSLLFSNTSCLMPDTVFWQELHLAAESTVGVTQTQKQEAICADVTPSSTSQVTPAHTTAPEKFLHVCSATHGMFSPSLLILFMSHCWDIVP